ncbi:MAG: sugar phosphate isomerase/epimerase [Gemmataceae bacterium]
MYLGYNTSGFAYHRLEDALAILADLGYRSVGLTLDYHSLDPFSRQATRRARHIAALLDKLGLRCVLETGARFLLDPRRKHQPTLISERPEERELRRQLIVRAIQLAPILHAERVSFWSGAAESPRPAESLWPVFLQELDRLLRRAEKEGITLCLEPEPGMLFDRLALWPRVRSVFASPYLKLTVDIGHLHCLGEVPIADRLRAWGHDIAHVHIEDMRAGVHEHLMFGEGEIAFEPVLQTLVAVNYQGCVCVELDRHAHDAPAVARRAYEYLHKHFS